MAEIKTHFDCPTQVAFYDLDVNAYVGGIAYGDEIICLECGGVIEIEDLIAEVREQDPDMEPFMELSWVGVSEKIL